MLSQSDIKLQHFNKICQSFALFCYGNKKPLNSTSFICKNTGANRMPIFVLICRFKCDFMQKMACQNAHCIGLIDGSILSIECVPTDRWPSVRYSFYEK